MQLSLCEPNSLNSNWTGGHPQSVFFVIEQLKVGSYLDGADERMEFPRVKHYLNFSHCLHRECRYIIANFYSSVEVKYDTN